MLWLGCCMHAQGRTGHLGPAERFQSGGILSLLERPSSKKKKDGNEKDYLRRNKSQGREKVGAWVLPRWRSWLATAVYPARWSRVGRRLVHALRSAAQPTTPGPCRSAMQGWMGQHQQQQVAHATACVQCMLPLFSAQSRNSDSPRPGAQDGSMWLADHLMITYSLPLLD